MPSAHRPHPRRDTPSDRRPHPRARPRLRVSASGAARGGASASAPPSPAVSARTAMDVGGRASASLTRARHRRPHPRTRRRRPHPRSHRRRPPTLARGLPLWRLLLPKLAPPPTFEARSPAVLRARDRLSPSSALVPKSDACVQ
jgi:hypothetical protein